MLGLKILRYLNMLIMWFWFSFSEIQRELYLRHGCGVKQKPAGQGPELFTNTTPRSQHLQCTKEGAFVFQWKLQAKRNSEEGGFRFECDGSHTAFSKAIQPLRMTKTYLHYTGGFWQRAPSQVEEVSISCSEANWYQCPQRREGHTITAPKRKSEK